MASPSLHIAERIAVPAQVAYDYTRDPANLPEWAAGLGGSIALVDSRWVVPSPDGDVVVEFAPVNGFGVLDHTVVLPDGTSLLNPLRVLPDGDDHCEVVFTLRRQPSMTEDDLARDAAAVTQDLARLKHLLEAPAPPPPPPPPPR